MNESTKITKGLLKLISLNTFFLIIGVAILTISASCQDQNSNDNLLLKDRYQTLAELPFENDYPTQETTRSLDEELYFQRGVQTYLWALPAVNMHAMKEGQANTFGEGYNVLAIFENRLKAHTLITTPNSDVIYGLGFLDLGKAGRMVIDVPPMLQALIDDFWHRPIEGPEIDGVKYAADIGLPGPDKGKGGMYLILPPGYHGPADESKYFVYRSRTNGVFVFLRGFFNDSDNLQPAVDNMENIKIYPLNGEAKPMDFKHASEIAANYLFAGDASYFDMLNRFVQSDVVDEDDPYMQGMMASIGIEKGKSFSPSARQRELLDAAARTAWKMAKNIAANFDREESALWWSDRQWVAHTKTDLDNFFDTHLDLGFNRYTTGHTDINGDFLKGDETYEITLPANVPANLFWSITVYDATTAAGLNNGQDYPSIGNRDKPVQNTDGSTTLYFGPKAPEGKDQNWMKTVPGKGWFVVLRLYGPEKGWFYRTWKPGDFEKIQ